MTIVIRVILDTPVCRLDPCRVFLAHLPLAGAGDGLEQFAAGPELQQVFAHVDVAAGPAWCLPALTCCQDTHTTPLPPTLRAIQFSPARSGSSTETSAGRLPPAWAAVVNRAAGVAMARDWCGRVVL